ncbi:hypothetical protein NY2A_b337L [Paramecium bursaria Chlorella virus NY2A]|uniref:Uncharacterized protein b337L n=1 Tax=Paramecium bursaria Chlorella virus NY2A TaxID=46021 RepID=A7IWL2_PBCVN|nr:hypothetical protein NY2A_b337L [Paramecium bursaria Chlorella virus NY2A]ABT14736.1 hypothetical protein NY2A_b337L [Paramecium bursaria Chlorella virus NY2A]
MQVDDHKVNTMKNTVTMCAIVQSFAPVEVGSISPNPTVECVVTPKYKQSIHDAFLSGFATEKLFSNPPGKKR